MLWSLGMVVLMVDIWHTLKLGGIDLVENDYWRRKAGKDTGNIMIMVNGKYVSDKERFHMYENASSRTIHDPVNLGKWLDITEIAKIFNWNSRQDQADGSWEKNIHNIIISQGKATTSPPLTTTEENWENPYAFTMRPLEQHEDDPEKVLHSHEHRRNLVAEPEPPSPTHIE